uniref:C-type lectin domain-containing protein n=1 Tax=Panagrolaimus davidi TaxID=227884 RepID=A0A914Q9M5_9BILA
MSSFLLIKSIILILYIKFVYSKCPPDTTFILESKCNKAVQLAKKFAEASVICKGTNNGQLTSIPNEYVNTYLNGVANEFFTPYAVTQFWIGANDLKIPNQWAWEDGLK